MLRKWNLTAAPARLGLVNELGMRCFGEDWQSITDAYAELASSTVVVAQPPVASAKAPSYEVLGLAPGAQLDVVKRAFRAMVLECHPDRENGDAERFRQVHEAYMTIVQDGETPPDNYDREEEKLLFIACTNGDAAPAVPYLDETDGPHHRDALGTLTALLGEEAFAYAGNWHPFGTRHPFLVTKKIVDMRWHTPDKEAGRTLTLEELRELNGGSLFTLGGVVTGFFERNSDAFLKAWRLSPLNLALEETRQALAAIPEWQALTFLTGHDTSTTVFDAFLTAYNNKPRRAREMPMQDQQCAQGEERQMPRDVMNTWLVKAPVYLHKAPMFRNVRTFEEAFAALSKDIEEASNKKRLRGV